MNQSISISANADINRDPQATLSIMPAIQPAMDADILALSLIAMKPNSMIIIIGRNAVSAMKR